MAHGTPSSDLICSRCGTTFLAAEKAERSLRCRQCRAELARDKYMRRRGEIMDRQRERRASDPESYAEYQRDYYQRNREKAADAQRRRHAANPEKYAEIRRRSKAKNLEARLAEGLRYRARKLGAPVVEDGVSWRAVVERDGLACSYCGVTCDPEDGRYVLARDGYQRWSCGPMYPTVDHVVALSQGGDHTMANAALSCCRCNKVKGARRYI